ncbi:sensor histidine kinase [Nonomuraea dietziae]|uniref:sensor histidine kinase n=1 Tax=Nonomuraea dietziae TaxID=65515 RepID=UPI00342B6E2E
MSAAVVLIGMGYGLATLIVLAGLGGLDTTLAWSSPAALTLTVCAGALLLLDRSPLAVVAGICWLAPIWTGWVGGPDLVRSLGSLAAPLLLPFLAHLMLGDRITRWGQAVTVALTAALVMVDDPLLRAECRGMCGENNVFLVVSWPEAARPVELARSGFIVLLGLLVVVKTGRMLGRAGPVALRHIGIERAVGALAVLALSPSWLWSPALQVAQATALTAFGASRVWSRVVLARRRSAAARLVRGLGSEPGAVEAALRRATGDRTLTVSYWLPVSGHHVDSAGHRVTLPPDAPATVIVRNGQQVATMLHHPALDLHAHLGAAARLAIDNERLRAEVLVQVEDLRQSQVRIVAAADEARRRLERDLHDGAQQRLLAVLYELQLADPPDGEALAQTRLALAELRQLAHGIFPVILDEGGLEMALWSLADRAPHPVEIRAVPAVRLPPAVERAIYLLVRQAANDAKGPMEVSVGSDGTLVAKGAPVISNRRIIDRVGALGGTLCSEPGLLRAEISCG